jgi:cytochrome c6
MGNALIWLLIGGPAHADEATAASFNKNCIGAVLTSVPMSLLPPRHVSWMHCSAGCHIGGGNVVQAGKTLFTGDLERNGAGTPEAIYDLVYGGKGKMPGYGTSCQPRVREHAGPSFTCRCVQRRLI